MYGIFVRVKNELNLHEWMLYYYDIGFTHIFIYDDDKLVVDKSIPSNKYTIINKFSWEHLECTDHYLFLNHNKKFYDKILRVVKANKSIKYLLYIDGDEYLCLNNKFNDISEFTKYYEPFDHLYINWLFFGNSNIKNITTENENMLLDKFIYSNDKLSHQGKSYVKIQNVVTTQCPHTFTKMRHNSIYKDVWNNKYSILSQSIFGLKPKHTQITEKQKELLNDIAVPFLAHFVVQSTEKFVKRRFFNFSFRSVVFNKSRKLFDEFHQYVINNQDSCINMIHNIDREKIKSLDVSDNVKQIINRIMDIYVEHNTNVLMNDDAFNKFVTKNKNVIY